MRLKDRLTVAFSGTVALVLLTSFGLIHVLVERDEERDLDRVLRVQAAKMAAQLADRSDQAPVDMDRNLSLPEGPQLTVLRAAIYDRSGAIVAATKSFAGKTPPFTALSLPQPVPESGATVELTADQVMLRGVVLPMDAKGERLLYAAPRKSIDDDLSFLSRIFVFLFVGAIGVTHLMARFLAARLVKDVDVLTEVAQSVADGQLAARVGDRARGSRETASLGVALDHMIGRLDALVSAQSTFLSHAAHELRSPLATLRGELQLALRRPRNEAEYREALEHLLRDVEQLSTLAEDLLTLARIQGRSPSARGRVPVEDLLMDAVKMAKGRADERGVTVAVDPNGAAGRTITGSRLDLVRALRNLLDNAIAHTKPGESVRLAARARGDAATVAVENPGKPVQTDDVDALFAPFFRGAEDQSSQETGAGLGLAIARGIARAHDGDVSLDQSFVGGARFLLTLPLD